MLFEASDGTQTADIFDGQTSPHAKRMRADIQRVARCPYNILITGETGTGKTEMARQVRRFSARANKPFIQLNCAILPEHLVEAELFGYRKGSFTGADHDRKGLFEEADGGILFLDEIRDIGLPVQIRLLKAIDRFLSQAGNLISESTNQGHRFQIDIEGLSLLCEFDYPGNIRSLRNLVFELTSYVEDRGWISFELVQSTLARLSSILVIVKFCTASLYCSTTALFQILNGCYSLCRYLQRRSKLMTKRKNLDLQFRSSPEVRAQHKKK